MNFLDYKKIRTVYDTDPNKNDILASFSVDDVLCLTASEQREPALRFWVHRPTAVLGIADGRLPNLTNATKYLTNQGYEVIIRNSGGLAVILDEGILNLSLVFPNGSQIDIHEGYQAMVEFVRWVFTDENISIEAYEIEGSYCPGTYDLSVDGKKFAGISQRRVKDGFAVQIYLSVESSGAARAEILKEFYKLGLDNRETKFEYPIINPSVMTSMEEILKKKITVASLVKRITDQLESSGIQLIERQPSDQEQDWFQTRRNMMQKRNERLERS